VVIWYIFYVLDQEKSGNPGRASYLAKFVQAFFILSLFFYPPFFPQNPSRMIKKLILPLMKELQSFGTKLPRVTAFWANLQNYFLPSSRFAPNIAEST
jgi:hypothetical protein